MKPEDRTTTTRHRASGLWASRRRWRAWRNLSLAERRLVVAALRMWPVCRLTLRRRGVQAARDRLFRAGAPVEHGQVASAVAPHRVAALVNALADRLPGKSTCLERSLLTASLLHRRGVAADVHIGVRQRVDELAFHAWVTVGDEVVNDDEQRVTEFEPLVFTGLSPGVAGADRFAAARAERAGTEHRRCFALAPDVVFKELPQGDAVLLALRTETYYALSPTANVVVEAVRAGNDLGGAARILHHQFGIDEHSALHDARSLLDELVRKGLLRPANSGAAALPLAGELS